MTPTEHRLIRDRLLHRAWGARKAAATARSYETRLRAEGRLKAYQVALRLVGRVRG